MVHNTVLFIQLDSDTVKKFLSRIKMIVQRIEVKELKATKWIFKPNYFWPRRPISRHPPRA